MSAIPTPRFALERELRHRLAPGQQPGWLDGKRRCATGTLLDELIEESRQALEGLCGWVRIHPHWAPTLIVTSQPEHARAPWTMHIWPEGERHDLPRNAVFDNAPIKLLCGTEPRDTSVPLRPAPAGSWMAFFDDGAHNEYRNPLFACERCQWDVAAGRFDHPDLHVIQNHSPFERHPVDLQLSSAELERFEQLINELDGVGEEKLRRRFARELPAAAMRAAARRANEAGAVMNRRLLPWVVWHQTSSPQAVTIDELRGRWRERSGNPHADLPVLDEAAWERILEPVSPTKQRRAMYAATLWTMLCTPRDRVSERLLAELDVHIGG